MDRWLAVGLGGALGACARHLLGSWVQQRFGSAAPGGTFPAGTFVVNLLGSYLIGFVMQWSAPPSSISPLLRFALTVGVLGGFTTYSAFSFETLTLLQKGSGLLAVINVAATLLLCLAATWLGLLTARALTPE